MSINEDVITFLTLFQIARHLTMTWLTRSVLILFLIFNLTAPKIAPFDPFKPVTTVLNTTLNLVGSATQAIGNLASPLIRPLAAAISCNDYYGPKTNDPVPPLPPITLSYSQFMRQYKPNSPVDRNPPGGVSYREQVYNQNVAKINNHNSDASRTYDMGLNLFADLDANEFRNQYLTLKVPASVANTAGTGPYVNPIMPNIVVDWSCQASGVITQGVCGACYAIAALESIEITMKMYGVNTLPLSFQEVIACGNDGNLINGCNNGYFEGAFNYVKANGVGLSISYPFQDNAKLGKIVSPCQTTRIQAAGYKSKKVTITRAQKIPLGDCVALVNKLKTRAIAVAIAGADGLQHYVSGTYVSGSSQINHGVTLIGYSPDKGYRVKNSWGPSWGQMGYGFLDESTGICNYAMYPVIPAEVNKEQPISCC